MSKKAKTYLVLGGFETDELRWEFGEESDLAGLSAAQVKWAVSKGLVEELD